jgi:outer membrane protein assembly factor BamB
MRFKRKSVLVKVLLLLVILLLVMGGLTGLGCVRGLQAIGWSGTVVVGDTLFTGSREGKLVAVDMADDSRQWSEPIQTAGSASILGCSACAAGQTGVAIYGTPAVSEDLGLAYIAGYNNGKVYAFSLDSLQKDWVYPVDDSLNAIVGGAVVASGRLYFGCSDKNLYALDAENGYFEWKFETGGKIWSTPAVAGGTVYFGSFDKNLYALDAATGEERWDKPFETEGAIVSTPLVYNDTVYFGAFDRHVYAVDAADGSLKWRSAVEAGNWFWANPIVYDGVIYAACLDGKVYMLDAEDGHEVADALDVGSPISSSPVMVDSSLVFASQEGVIYTVNTESNELRALADLEIDVYSPLGVNDGIIYIHTQDLTLHRIDASTGARLMSISLDSSE